MFKLKLELKQTQPKVFLWKKNNSMKNVENSFKMSEEIVETDQKFKWIFPEKKNKSSLQ